MSYTVFDDLEQVYDSRFDVPEVESDWSETHYRVTGKLRRKIVALTRTDTRRRFGQHSDNVFLLFGLNHKTYEVTFEVGYGPGECDLHFVTVPFEQSDSVESSLLYWLVGLR